MDPGWDCVEAATGRVIAWDPEDLSERSSEAVFARSFREIHPIGRGMADGLGRLEDPGRGHGGPTRQHAGQRRLHPHPQPPVELARAARPVRPDGRVGGTDGGRAWARSGHRPTTGIDAVRSADAAAPPVPSPPCGSSPGRKNDSRSSRPPSSRAGIAPRGCASTTRRPWPSSPTRCSRPRARVPEYAEVEAAGRPAVDPGEVIDGVRALLDEVRVEVLLGDGARVIALNDPLGRGDPPDPLGPGALVIGDAADVVVNEGREAIELEVRSESRRRIRISSHYPFERANQRLVFDREAARGFRLDLPAGGYTGWEPGETKTVRLVRYAGTPDPDEGTPVSTLSAEEYRAALRRHDRRPRPARRHRSLGARRGGPDRARRRARLGLREEPPLADGAVGPRGRAVGARRRAHGGARRSTRSSAS